MSARDAILAAVRRNASATARASVPPPDPPDGTGPTDGTGPPDLVAQFAQMAGAAGARVIESDDPEAAIREGYPEARRIASATDRVEASTETQTDRDLADVDLFVCAARLGVAENGAVWLSEDDIGARVAPFLAPHVAILLPRAALVPTMHEAYRRIEGDHGFGVFVAGPSKTADIEQSLVIGAHGPVSLLVVLTDAVS